MCVCASRVVCVPREVRGHSLFIFREHGMSETELENKEKTEM